MKAPWQALWLDLQLALRRRSSPIVLFILLLAGISGVTAPVSPTIPSSAQSDPRHRVALEAFQRLRLSPVAVVDSEQAFLALARQQGLQVDQAVFLPPVEDGHDVVRHGLRLSLVGNYRQWRAFLQAALATHPALAIRQLTLERDAATAGSDSLHGTLTAEFMATGRAS